MERVLADEKLLGPVNAVSPEPITNAQFATSLGRVLRRPAVLPVPAFAVSLFFGEMGQEALLASARVRPARLLESGFAFRFSELAAALELPLTDAE